VDGARLSHHCLDLIAKSLEPLDGLYACTTRQALELGGRTQNWKIGVEQSDAPAEKLTPRAVE